jgi:Putative S-adenosyl-L-methionine-dependent methyltransferase
MRELVRKNIGRRLAEYYAQPPNAVVGTSAGTESTRLSSSLGEWHWRRLLDRFYKERQGHWLTPVELFQPHFSHILGDFCLSAVDASMEGNARRLEIVELGGGRGTNARHILSYIQHTRPEIYDGLTYTLVDSSPSLNQLQKDVFADTVHTNRVGFRHMDLMDVAERR